MPTIITIVEGRGEVSAVPILIRRIAAAVVSSVVPQVSKPIRVKRGRFLKVNELERYVDLAARQAGSDDRILIILDADDDCPAERASEILERAMAVRSDRRIQAVLAQREYEAWFLAAADSIAGHRELRCDTTAPADPESVRDAKEWLILTHAAGAGVQRNSRPASTYHDVQSRSGETRSTVIRQDVAYGGGFDAVISSADVVSRLHDATPPCSTHALHRVGRRGSSSSPLHQVRNTESSITMYVNSGARGEMLTIPTTHSTPLQFPSRFDSGMLHLT